MSALLNTRIVLASRPNGEPDSSNLRLERVAIAEPGPGQVLLRNLYLSLDPYMRGRMDEARSYAPSVAIDDVMEGRTVAEVMVSRHPDFSAGEKVVATGG